MYCNSTMEKLYKTAILPRVIHFNFNIFRVYTASIALRHNSR